ncbi:MAG: 30S ribosomal protein S6 [Nitrospirae bacterium]|nr:30S ribosomal protein S6 [Nitrospirota bacterium]
MNYYEKVIIFDPNLDDSAVEETVGKVKDVIVRQGGEILKTENWGRRKLAYILNKHQKGNYIFLLFKAPSATIAELERFCKVVDFVIKFMVVKLTKKKQIEAVLSALTQSSAKSESRDAAKPAHAKTSASREGEAASEGK